MSEKLICGVEGCNRKAARTRGPYYRKIDDVPVCQQHFYGRFPCAVCAAPSIGKRQGDYLCSSHRHMLQNYGMTVTEMKLVDWMRSEGVMCPICQVTPVAVTDHHHDAGHVRGALCDFCNVALGRFQDNPTTMRRAAAFIELDTLAPGETWKNQLEEAERRMNEDAEEETE